MIFLNGQLTLNKISLKAVSKNKLFIKTKYIFVDKTIYLCVYIYIIVNKSIYILSVLFSFIIILIFPNNNF